METNIIPGALLPRCIILPYLLEKCPKFTCILPTMFVFLHTYMCIYMCFIYYIYRFCIFILRFLSNMEYRFICF